MSKRCCGRRRKFFFGKTAAFKVSRQVYNQKLIYRIMVIVNGSPLLWITQVLSTTSNVYGSHKAVGWSCMCLVAKLDKKSPCAKSRASPHFVPVDIHTLIHSLDGPVDVDHLVSLLNRITSEDPWSPPEHSTTSSWAQARPAACWPIA